MPDANEAARFTTCRRFERIKFLRARSPAQKPRFTRGTIRRRPADTINPDHLMSVVNFAEDETASFDLVGSRASYAF
ncbi:hypothetical protein D9M70_614250 [compost metagenome]